MTNLQLAKYLTRVICRMARMIRGGWCVSESEYERQEEKFLSELDSYEEKSWEVKILERELR